MIVSEIYLEMTFDAGHRIVGHKGKCARLHGHTYRVEIRATGPVQEPGFVVDFGDIKDKVNEWDHKLLVWENDPMFIELDWGIYDTKDVGIHYVPFNPTAENMADHLAQELLHGFDLLSVLVTLWETPKASATAMLEKDSVMLK